MWSDIVPPRTYNIRKVAPDSSEIERTKGRTFKRAMATLPRRAKRPPWMNSGGHVLYRSERALPRMPGSTAIVEQLAGVQDPDLKQIP